MIGDEDEIGDDNWVRIPQTVVKDQSSAVCVSLRQLQYRRGCSNVLLDDVLQTMRPYLLCFGPATVTAEDKKMQVFQYIFCFYCDLFICL